MSFPTSLKVQNTNGYLNFSGDAVYTCDSTLHKIHSDGFYTLNAQDYILIQNQNAYSNVDIISHNISLNLTSSINSANSIVITGANIASGIELLAGSGGVSTSTSNGDIDFAAAGANINIGVSPLGTPALQQTQNVNIECFNILSANAADMYFVSSDVISFVSSTGDIEFGTSNGAPVIKLQNGNLLVNQSSSILDRQVDIAVTHQSNSKPGYNGLVINSFASNVASDLTLQTSNTVADQQCILNMGAFPENDNYASYQTYFGYQTTNVVIRLDGPAYSPNRGTSGFGVDFTYNDIGRTLYWPLSDLKSIIQSIGSLIIGNNNPGDLTITGTYTGTSSQVYLLQIDSTATSGPNTFMWSNDGGNTFQYTFIPITGGSQYLENGISIQFSATTGYTLYQQFTFQTKIIAYVDTTVPVPVPLKGELFYSLQPYYAYIGTETASDLVIKTNNKEKIRITADGAIGIQQNNPSACLELDSNYNKILIVNQTTLGYQINPSVSQINVGGYVIVWNSETTSGLDTNVFDVYGQIYMTDGARYGNNFQINKTSSNYQSFPSVAAQRATNSPYFAVTWGSNNAGTFNVYSQIIHNTIPMYNFDILVGIGGPSLSNYNQPYPRIAALYNGTYVTVWSAFDTIAGFTRIVGRIMNNSGGFDTTVFPISDPGALTARNYPYVAGLPENDPYLPNGFVVGFMVKVDTGIDLRYTISVRLFNSNGTPSTAEIPITSIGSVAYSSITDGLLSVAEINNKAVNDTTNGGFLLAFYRNYVADATLYNPPDGILGTQSGATASISATYPNDRIITVQNVSNRFLVSEEIQIASTVPNVGICVEKIAAIDFLTTNTANITLDTGYRSVVAYRYNSNMTTASSNVWNIQVNTSPLFQDLDRFNIPSNSTVFEYKRPLAAIAIDNDGTAIISWSNGSIPSIYYQLINVSSGVFINAEQRLTSQYDGLKQRDQVVTHLQSIEGNDFGFIISWDNQDLDISGAGVYQQLIGYDHSIVRFEDGNNNIIFNHSGQLGIGTFEPTATLHIKAPPTTSFNNPANPVSLILQNTASHIIVPTVQQSLTFINGSNTQLGAINVTNSLRYNDLYPQPSNLIGFYKFDQSEGTQVPDSSSSGSSNLAVVTYVNTNGILVNFDVENCWVSGLINNALGFSGSNNYVFVDSTATNGLNTVLETAQEMSISVWINVSSNVVVGSTMDLVGNGSDFTIAGSYRLTLQDLNNNGALYVCSNIVVDAVSLLDPGIDIGVQSIAPINDGNWHLINMTASVISSGSLNLYVDSALQTSASFSNTITYVQHTGYATTFGISTLVNPTNTFFRGYMDELRFYNTVLSQNEITQLYTYGSQQRGTVIIAANNDNNINTALTIDDTGKFNNLNCKPLPYSILSGVITAYSDSTIITGAGTLFTQQIAPGDLIVLDTISDTEFTVISVTNDIYAFLNVRGYNGPEDSKSYESVLRKPNIFSFFDNGDNIQGYINSYGNLTVGNGTSASKLSIVSSSGTSKGLPQIMIGNTDNSDLAFARQTALNFAGIDVLHPLNSHIELAQIAVSHFENGHDNRGIMQIALNDGSTLANVVSINATGNVGIGGQNSPIAQLHMIRETQDCTMVMESGYPKNYAVFDEQNYLYFAGTTSIGQTSSATINDQMLSAVRGSNDSNTLNLDGRIDFMTNNLSNNTNGLETRMSVTSNGYVGIGVQRPMNTLQVGPELRIGNNVNTIIDAYTTFRGSIVKIDQNIFINYLTPNTQLYLVGATVVVGTTTLTTAKILYTEFADTIEVDVDFTDSVGLPIYISFAGLNTTNNGLVGINTTSPNTALHVNGGLSLGIQSTGVDFDLGDDNATVTLICYTTSNAINITLPNTTTRDVRGRLFFIKNAGGYTVHISPPAGDSALIDGAPFVELLTQYSCIRLQFLNSHWWIV